MQVSTWRADVVLYACSVHVVTPSGIVVWATTLGAGSFPPRRSRSALFGTHCSAELVHSNSTVSYSRHLAVQYTEASCTALHIRLSRYTFATVYCTYHETNYDSPLVPPILRSSTSVLIVILHVGPPLLGGSGEGVHELRLACAHHRAGPYPAPCGRARRARRSSAASPSRPSRADSATACRCGRP